MPTSYPGAIDSLPRPSPGSPRNVAPYAASTVIDNISDAIEAIEAKLGTGASTAAANQVLRGTGSGATAFGTVDTAHIAANAVSQLQQANGTTADPTTTSTGSFVVIPEMTITMTTTGGVLVAFFTGRFLQQSGTRIGISAHLDGTNAAASERSHIFAGTDYEALLGFVYLWTPSAGSHTVTARWYTSGGTAKAVSTHRTLIVAELKR